MKYILLGGCLLASLTLLAQPTPWVARRLDERLTIKFPASGQELNLPATMQAANAPGRLVADAQARGARAFRAEDIVATYLVVVTPFSGPTNVPAQAEARAAYYKNHLVPLLLARAHGELISHSLTVQNGLDVLTITFRALGPTGAPITKFMRQLTIGNYIYQLFFVPKDGSGQTSIAQRNTFFDTLTINAPK